MAKRVDSIPEEARLAALALLIAAAGSLLLVNQLRRGALG
jgi:hypothetical protein